MDLLPPGHLAFRMLRYLVTRCGLILVAQADPAPATERWTDDDLGDGR
jgi:hypothetical protein